MQQDQTAYIRELENKIKEWEKIAKKNEFLQGGIVAKTILEAIASPIFVKDENLVYIECNEAFLKYLGKSKDEVIGKTPYDVSPKEKADIYVAQDKSLMESKEVQIYESKVRYADGTDRDVIFHKSVIIDDHGNARGIVGTITDISERKKSECEREKMQTHIFHQEKLASIGILAAGIAHEINNPLTIIMGNMRLLKEKVKKHIEIEKDDPTSEYDINCSESLGMMMKAAERISNIVLGIRYFSRADVSKVEIINLHLAIIETVNIIQGIFSKDEVKIVLDLKCQDASIMANLGKIQQVFMNLLTNSRDAIRETKKSGEIQISSWSQDESIIIQFKDNGIGMNDEQKKKVFDAFYTTKEPGKGTGLGLSISRTIVESFGGEIRLESEKNVGTLFILTFPKKTP